MARRETTGKHTATTLNHLAQLLEEHAASLRAAAVLLEVEPAIEEIDVRYEHSRSVGLEYVTTWVNAAKQSAFSARMEKAQNHSTRQSGTPGPKGRKPRNS